MDGLVINCIDNPEGITDPKYKNLSIDEKLALPLEMNRPSKFNNCEVLLADISRHDQGESLDPKYGNGISGLKSSVKPKLEDSDEQEIAFKENGGPTVVTDEEIRKANNINNITNQRCAYPINTDNMEVIVDLNCDNNLHKTNAFESIRSFDSVTGDNLEKISQISLSTGSISDTGSSNESVTSSSTSNYKDRESVEKDFAREKIYSDMLLQREQNMQEIVQLRSVIDRLQSERAHLEVEASHSVCRSQIEQQRREIELFRQEQELDRRTQATMKLEFESLKKQYETANKEREASVMRYAVNEMEVINQRKERESLEKKYKESQKEKEGLSSKLKTVMIEKNRISQLLDSKCSELANTQRDVEKLKEELNSRDIKIKWTQNKLKSEMERHKESEAQVERLTGKILEAKEEIEKAKRDAETAIKQFQFSQENKAHVLEQQLKEQQAQLILERHSLEDKEGNNKQLIHELNTLRDKQFLLSDENNALKLKVASLEKEMQENGQTMNRLRGELERSAGQVGELQARTSTMDSLGLQLQQAREDLASLQVEASALRTTNAELLSDMASCREREAEMLEFTQKVTSKNVRLQNEYSCIEAKARQLQCEEEPLQRRISELTKRVETLEKELSKERAERADEKKVVARHLAEKTAKAETLVRELDDLKGENHVMKQKHTITLRELNREVAGYRKRLEQFENSSGSDSLCQGSRASSCTSLNEATPAPPTVTANTQMEPDKQAMVNRILRLQRDGVRLREKIEFLEEHGRTLVTELQKKTRLLQSYLLREQAGTLTSGSVDANKAELARHGGIMASMYTSKPVDDSMTLELSLEINRKLQAVLEDTLLKNITLKENIDTLGDEIRRLSKKS